MKKFISYLLAGIMLFSLTACGGGKAPSSQGTASKSSEGSSSEEKVTLDYDAIADWVKSCYIGVTASEEAVLLGFSEDTTQAILMFGDPASGDAISFVGECTKPENDSYTVADTINKMSYTFKVTAGENGSYRLDIGDGNVALVDLTEVETFLAALKTAIDSFNQVA